MIEIERGDGWAGYSMIDEIRAETMTTDDAAAIVDRLIRSGKPPAAMTDLERAAVRIVWAQLQRQLEPVHAALSAFAGAMQAAVVDLARALEPILEPYAPKQQAFPGSRPAWQRRA
jgi:hypothetical protein